MNSNQRMEKTQQQNHIGHIDSKEYLPIIKCLHHEINLCLPKTITVKK